MRLERSQNRIDGRPGLAINDRTGCRAGDRVRHLPGAAINGKIVDRFDVDSHQRHGRHEQPAVARPAGNLIIMTQPVIGGVRSNKPGLSGDRCNRSRIGLDCQHGRVKQKIDSREGLVVEQFLWAWPAASNGISKRAVSNMAMI